MRALLLAVWLLIPSVAWAYLPALQAPALRNPIVLVHGATMKGSTLDIGPLHLGEYFKNLPAFLSQSGTPVKVVNLTTDSSIGERAAVLKNYLETEFPAGVVVNIIAHSLGGLDARYAVSVLGCQKIASITTIGTPHRGSPLADWAVEQTKGGKPWYWFFRLLGFDMAKRRFLPELTTGHMSQIFNQRVLDSPEVRYFSVRTRASFTARNMSYLFWFTSRWLEGRNHYLNVNGHDGLVPYDSQEWGTLIASAEIDHLAQINHHRFRPYNLPEQVYATYRVMYAYLYKEGL